MSVATAPMPTATTSSRQRPETKEFLTTMSLLRNRFPGPDFALSRLSNDGELLKKVEKFCRLVPAIRTNAEEYRLLVEYLHMYRAEDNVHVRQILDEMPDDLTNTYMMELRFLFSDDRRERRL